MTAAFSEGRIDDYFACFADEASFVFHTTAERLESRAEYLEMWRRWVLEDDLVIISCVSSRQMVQVVGKDAAVFVHDVETLLRTHSGTSTEHERETIIFSCQQDGRWRPSTST